VIYHHLFERAGDRQVRVGLIGTGTYGVSLLAQAQSIAQLEIPVVCDQDVEVARRACLRAGIPQQALSLARDRKSALQALDQGKCIIAEDAALLMDLPLDVIVECTGHPEAGACYAELAIQHGKHVAMVTKETDSVIGPMLKRMADSASVVYTPADGDQHGLLMGLVSWARCLGLDVIAGGKARANDFVYDEGRRAVTVGTQRVTLTPGEMGALRQIGPGEATQVVQDRRRVLEALPQIGEPDACESVIAANATGLMPDTPAMHAPVARTTEIPEVLCLKHEGGILSKPGAIDVVTCLRRPDEAGLAGGVFIVFSCHNPQAWDFLRAKGIHSNHRGTCGLLTRPYHLLGVETPISILCAGLLNLSTGGVVFEPHVDLVARTAQDLKAGDVIPHGPQPADLLLEPLILPATRVAEDNPLPYHMAVGNRVRVDVPAGTVLAGGMIEPPASSRLWELRREQDRTFNTTT
jgi:predicted homoserine dehydrogenase-like protein